MKQISIMPCLDMQNGRVVKGVHFVDIHDAGDPVECAKAYCAAGADEIALLDITATVEGRGTMLEVVRKVAEAATVPFTVGGGISDVSSAKTVLDAGADKVSTSSAAFRKPEVIAELQTDLFKGLQEHLAGCTVNLKDCLMQRFLGCYQVILLLVQKIVALL